jgi:hypothetical protein
MKLLKNTLTIAAFCAIGSVGAKNIGIRTTTPEVQKPVISTQPTTQTRPPVQQMGEQSGGTINEKFPFEKFRPGEAQYYDEGINFLNQELLKINNIREITYAWVALIRYEGLVRLGVSDKYKMELIKHAVRSRFAKAPAQLLKTAMDIIENSYQFSDQQFDLSFFSK